MFCQEYYEPWGITYKGIQLVDVPQTNITIYFNEVVDFIDQALTAGGKVLVNCEMGMSRSSTCVLAYLMLRHQMSAGEALAKVSKNLHLFSMKRKLAIRFTLDLQKSLLKRPCKSLMLMSILRVPIFIYFALTFKLNFRSASIDMFVQTQDSSDNLTSLTVN